VQHEVTITTSIVTYLLRYRQLLLSENDFIADATYAKGNPVAHIHESVKAVPTHSLTRWFGVESFLLFEPVDGDVIDANEAHPPWL